MSLRDERIAVVGATGAVGVELLRLLEAEGAPPERVSLLASAKSAGRRLPYADTELVVRPIEESAVAGCTLAMLAASSAVAREWAPRFVGAGAVVVDCSSAFRMDEGVPLVIPEVNADLVAGRREPRVIANPNCSTIVLLMALTPLKRRFGCERIDVSTYQAVSGAGAAAMEELRAQTAASLAGEPLDPSVFREPCAFNVFSHDTPVDAGTGMNTEETKMVEETRKIWGDPNVAINPTCVRVPALRAHCESVRVRLATPASEAQVRETLEAAPGVRVVDDRAEGAFPTSRRATEQEEVLAGRIRPDWSDSGEAPGEHRAFCMFLAGDQLLKGAALNAVQITKLVF